MYHFQCLRKEENIHMNREAPRPTWFRTHTEVDDGFMQK